MNNQSCFNFYPTLLLLDDYYYFLSFSYYYKNYCSSYSNYKFTSLSISFFLSSSVQVPVITLTISGDLRISTNSKYKIFSLNIDKIYYTF